MELWEVLIVAGTAGAGAVITAVAGLGGGILMLAVLLQFLDPAIAIPVHAVIQLASNGSRAALLRQHIDWPIVARFVVLLLPAGFLGLWAANSIPSAVGRAAIGVFALVAVWRPTALASTSRLLGSSDRSFTTLGAISGFLSIPLGATGPMVAPYFRQRLPVRTAMVATFAATQVAGHVSKTVVFGTDGFAFSDYYPVMVTGIAAVTIGSWIGTKLLGRVSEERFQLIFRITITLIALRLIVQAAA
ncbi:MAG: putative membrane protein YfcA [Candidatus Poriferisodalaceae bacterium]|jgi:uncharacterized membrane protein YfcA